MSYSAMQFLSALLAGFFFWLMLFRLFRRRRERARQEAGPLLLAVRLPRWARLAPCILLGFYAVLLAGQFALIVAIMRSLDAQHWMSGLHFMISTGSFALSIGAAMWTAIILFFVFPSNRRIDFEIRERGVLQIAGLLKFVPWSRVAECRWFAVRSLLGIPLYWRGSRRFARSRFTIVERGMAKQQKPAITAVVSQFAPVFDSDGALLAAPAGGKNTSVELSPRCCRWRFQFDLESLLLFTVVVSCIASCYGMHERRLRPQREAFHTLNAFHPFSIDSDDVVTWLDFSRRDKKPGDADLASLEPLEDLSSLNLCGAPITDAGLVHLKGLHRLELLRLSTCAITDAGLSHLHGLLRLDLLDLSHCAITDAGLVHLRQLQQLRFLSLSGCRITDAGLLDLEGLRSLRSLNLTNTGVTAKGVAKLHRVLPNAEISYGPAKAPVVVPGAERK